MVIKMDLLNLNNMLKKFEEITINKFNYLVNDYNFNLIKMEKFNFNSYKDMYVEIKYVNEYCCIKIIWYIGGANIGISIIELINKEIPVKVSPFPKKGYGRLISLDYLEMYYNNGESKSILYSYDGNYKSNEIVKRFNKNDEIIKNNMEQIIDDCANRLKVYKTQILTNYNSDIIIQVQLYYKSVMEKILNP